MVPSRAVIERDGRPLVFVVKDGRAQWTYIVPGRTNGVDTEVLPDSTTGQIPVNAGDQIITEGHLTLTHDAPVRVTAPREGLQGRERLTHEDPVYESIRRMYSTAKFHAVRGPSLTQRSTLFLASIQTRAAKEC